MTSWANASGRILVWVVVVLLVVTGGKQSQLLLQLKLSWVCKLEWSLTTTTATTAAQTTREKTTSKKPTI